MSVRLGLAKVAGLVAGTALIGGGAVHIAEKASSNKPQYVKHAKAHKAPVRKRVVTRTVVVQKDCCTRTVTRTAMVPMPPPGLPAADLTPNTPAPAPSPLSAERARGYYSNWGFGGGYIGGFFGGTSGNVIVVNSSGSTTGSTSTTGGTTTSTTGGTTTSTTGGTTTTTTGGTTTTTTGGTTTTTGGTTTTTTGGTTSTSTTGGTQVPAPPMLLLFGGAAGAMFARRRKGKAQAA
ncbi:PEP-CTERM sorting domain-containing protein [Novosphingobium humi]|uniref:PEP-CTERM sorting domain-containing protein n=1 Tax=Novosphingobium humi TaxID=2282397 RepID=A0ABY7TW67_9SPHN|nr:PEP-CTERM sorting domain-containing protein [Novosphingobium humi]WCT77175.1 PEP-CTERM sorting domain-containing protein [Novosphingobium humi]WJS99305.1 PEP-CTERM sorting domain-containing protein [Novosphingobium humi]